MADFAPKRVELTDAVLFGLAWKRPQLSKRDRILITRAALVAIAKTGQLGFHFPRALVGFLGDPGAGKDLHIVFDII